MKTKSYEIFTYICYIIKIMAFVNQFYARPPYKHILDIYMNNAECINAALYAPDSSSHKYLKYVDELDKLFTIAPKITTHCILYRGIHNEESVSDSIIDDEDYPFKKYILDNVGNDIQFKTYLSTSYELPSAINFSSGLLFEMAIKVGTQFIPVSYWDNNIVEYYEISEKEILLPRNMSFHIDAVETQEINEKTYTIVKMHNF